MQKRIRMIVGDDVSSCQNSLIGEFVVETLKADMLQVPVLDKS